MKSCEILDMKGQLTIQKRNKDGQIIKEINMNNSIVLSGRDLVAKLFIKEAIAPVSHVAAGKGTKDVDPATDK